MESSQMILTYGIVILASYLYYRERKRDQLNKNILVLIDSVNELNNNIKQFYVQKSNVSDKNICLKQESIDEDFSNHWLFLQEEPKTIKRDVIDDSDDDIIIEM